MSAMRLWSAFARRAAGRAGARPLAGEGGAKASVASRCNHAGARPSAGDGGAKASAAFRCNPCGRANEVSPARIGREIPSCAGCGSTVRFRAIARLVIRELLGSDAALCDVAADRRIRGLGLSDAGTYAKPLQRVFSYGFGTGRIADERCATFGIAWPEPFSVPRVARAR